MIKFIYTDIDGVLSLGSEINPKQTTWGLVYRFNKKAVEIFNRILDLTDADIVVSSDWRNSYTLKELGEIFEWQGVIKKPVSVTPYIPYTRLQYIDRDRVIEIKTHVEEHNPDIWVAIDDLNLHQWWTGVLVHDADSKNNPNFVHTPRWMEGIKQSGKKEEILKKLNI